MKTKQQRLEARTGNGESKADFEQGAIEVLGRLQSALRTLLAETPGVTRKPIELAQNLGIHGKLAWQAHRLAHAADPLQEAANVPGPGAMRRFLEAAEKRGSPHECIVAVQEALRDLRELIKQHAGSRGEFETMVSALTQTGSEQVDLVQKRAAFKAQSHILGVQAKTHLGCFIYQPSKTVAGRADCALIRGLIGLRWFRPDASWVVSQTRVAKIDGTKRRILAGEPLDRGVDAKHGMNLLTQFCSQPIPRIRRVPSDLQGLTNIEIIGDGVGNTSAVTCLVGELFRGASPLQRGKHDRLHISNLRVRTPCEVLVHDVLVHRDMAGLGRPQLDVYSDHRAVDVRLEVQLEARACDRLALKESVIYLGKGPGVLESPDVPRYAEMVRYALGQAGWDPEHFDVYRCRIEYPVMPSSVVVHFELPRKPS